jgi:translation initiation factor 1
MVDIDPVTGLPKELVSFEDIAKEDQKITVKIEKRKFGKKYTVITGLGKDIDIKDVLKKLKNRMACGGTAKNNSIELQGDHKSKVRDELIKLGFLPDTIHVQ